MKNNNKNRMKITFLIKILAISSILMDFIACEPGHMVIPYYQKRKFEKEELGNEKLMRIKCENISYESAKCLEFLAKKLTSKAPWSINYNYNLCFSIINCLIHMCIINYVIVLK